MHPTNTYLLFWRLQRRKRDEVLSFVSPDGKLTLMEYRYLLPTSKSLSVPSVQIPVPFTLKPTITVEESGGMPDRSHRLHSTNRFRGPSMSVWHRGCRNGFSTR